MSFGRLGLILLLLCSGISVFGQILKEYVDRSGARTHYSSAYYYSVGLRDSEGRMIDSVKSYYAMNDHVYSLEFRGRFGNRIGTRLTYHENGMLKSRVNYEKHFGKEAQQHKDSISESILYFADSAGQPLVNEGQGKVDGILEFLPERGLVRNGHRDSVWTTFRNNGKIYCQESWNDGEFVDGVSYDSLGNEYFYRQPFAAPVPTYGYQEFYRESSEKMVYPHIAQRRGIQGRVLLKFVVEVNGDVTSPEVVRGLGFGCDEEAVKLLRSSAPWLPARLRGQPVRYTQVIPIVFKLK